MTDEDAIERRFIEKIAEQFMGTECEPWRVLTIAFRHGLATPPWELLPGGYDCTDLWIDLVAALAPLGWHANVGWLDSSGELVLLPPDKTLEDWNAGDSEWMTVETYGNGDTVVRHGFGVTHAESPEAEREDPLSVLSWLTHRTVQEAVDRIGKTITWEDVGCGCAVTLEGEIEQAHPKCKEHYGQEPRCKAHGGVWALYQCPLKHRIVPDD